MTTTPEAIKDAVRQRYGQAARRAANGANGPTGCGGGSSGCCGADAAAAAAPGAADPISGGLYSAAEQHALPAQALQASLGCGNPTALAELQPGQTVLDLGSGGGIDVLLSARRVGPTGKAWGLDLTDEMLELARANQRRAGVTNAEFVKGDIEAIPLPDASVDVVVSNCVINLAADKDRVLREAFRVLRPGGRFAVSDVVVRGPVEPALRRNIEAWIGCIAGALEVDDYRERLARAGFGAIDIEITRVYEVDAGAAASCCGDRAAAAGPQDRLAATFAAGRFAAALIRATKPAAPDIA